MGYASQCSRKSYCVYNVYYSPLVWLLHELNKQIGGPHVCVVNGEFVWQNI